MSAPSPFDATGIPIHHGDLVLCAIEGALAEGVVLDVARRPDGCWWIGVYNVLPDGPLWRMAGECRITEMADEGDDDESPLYYCASQVP